MSPSRIFTIPFWAFSSLDPHPIPLFYGLHFQLYLCSGNLHTAHGPPSGSCSPSSGLITSTSFLTAALSPHWFTPSRPQLLFPVTRPTGSVLPLPPHSPSYLNKSSALPSLCCGWPCLHRGENLVDINPIDVAINMGHILLLPTRCSQHSFHERNGILVLRAL